MKKKGYIAFFHGDLDGIVSYLVLRWTFPKQKIPYIIVNNGSEFKDVLTDWFVNNNLEDYEQVFILDLDISNSYDLIDESNVFIIDHHESHFFNMKKCKNAKVAVKVYSSCAKLMYKLFSKLYKTKLSNAQKILVGLADDYDCYKLASPLSKQLNIVFWQTNYKYESFIKQFYDGFKGFTFYQKNMVNIYFRKLNNIQKTLKIYKGKINFKNKEYNVISTFATEMINDVAEYLLETYKADIVIVINVDSNKASFRKNKNIGDDLSLAELAEEISNDNGGGHAYAAGCALSDEFLEFTKGLTPT